ncbi:MAG TPA: FecR domain-containing protein [Elusimicrobiota bacterium]|nr:FecR domain-containing protein [Elusimicrobiota bacterium]
MIRPAENIIRTMIPALLLMGLSASPLSAEHAKIHSYKSTVEVQHKGETKWFTVRKGLDLKEGDRLRTGSASKAEVALENGSRLKVSANSTVRVDSLSKLSRMISIEIGKLKAIVKKLGPQDKFSVKTPIAAASVRGTIFEMGYDGTNGSLDVYKGLVSLTQDGQEVFLRSGERIDFIPDRPLGTPSPRRSPGGEGSQGSRSEIRREVGLSMSKEEVMAAAAEEMRLAEYQVGKTLIDVHGKRVRLEEYVIRKPREVAAADQDKAFKLVVLNERDDRFDYFYYKGIFNRSLPDDLSVALKDVSGKIGTTAPDYYLTQYEMAQSNTQDFIKDNASGGHLVKITYDGTNYTLTDPDNPTNTKTVTADEQSISDGVTYHKIYDPINDLFTTVTDDQYAAGDFKPAVFDPGDDNYRYLTTADTVWKTRYNSYSHVINDIAKQSYTVKTTLPNTLAIDLDAVFTYAGGYALPYTETPSGSDYLHNRVTVFYGDGTKEAYDTYIISDDGTIATKKDFAGITSGAAYKTELLKWNYEQVITATEFNGRKIDLVVEPKILIKSGLVK